ncbi:MAG TPA: hypothetical protein VIJ40_05325 [Acidimicrobiales bacterium]
MRSTKLTNASRLSPTLGTPSTTLSSLASASATLLRADGVTVSVVASGQVANKSVITTTAQ